MADNEFSWVQWTPNTTLRFYRVPWDGSYRDLVNFDTREQQNAYFDNLNHAEARPATMHPLNQPVLIEASLGEIAQWNYCVAINDYPTLEPQRRWYYFIQSVEFVAPRVTRLNLMLDVWQSFQLNVSFGNCYVVRGHIGMANDRSFDAYGRTYLALPEGLDTGQEGLITDQRFSGLTSLDGNDQSYGVMVMSTANLEVSPGTADAPVLTTASGSRYGSQANGVSVYYFEKVSDFIAYCLQRGANYPWVTQCITGIWWVNNSNMQNDKGHGRKIGNMFGQTINNAEIYDMESDSISNDHWQGAMRWENFRDGFNIPQRYRKLKKLLVYPYCWIELTTLNGDSTVLKPEDIQSNDLNVRMAWNYAPPSPRIMYFVPDYNTGGAQAITPLPNGRGLPIDGGEFLGHGVAVSQLPTFAAVNNGATLAMANSAYTRDQSVKNAQWTQDKTTRSARLAQTQAYQSADVQSLQTRLANENRNAQAAISINSATMANNIAVAQNRALTRQNQLGTVVNTGINSAVALSEAKFGKAIGGAASGAWSVYDQGVKSDIAVGSMSANLSNQIDTLSAQTRQANQFASQSTDLSTAQTERFADQNYGLAQWAAQGDYANTIANINAQVQQMALTPPSTSGLIGGDNFNLANGIMGVLVRLRTCAPSALASVGEFLLRYGYFVQRYITPPNDMMCMTKATYWQMGDCYCYGNCPEQYRLTIKGMFEQGCTVWRNANDIGHLDWADNDTVGGISY